jgi:hypothetical protein
MLTVAKEDAGKATTPLEGVRSFFDLKRRREKDEQDTV